MSSPPPVEELPPWARKIIMRGSAAYAATSITASAIAAGHLAWTAGYTDPRAVLFGAAFEVAAVVTGTAWAAGTPGHFWYTTGRRATLGLFAASLVIQAAEVLQVRGNLPAGGLLAVAIAVSFVFPTLALVFGHLGLTARRAFTTTDRAGQPLRLASSLDGHGSALPPALPTEETSPAAPPPAAGDTLGSLLPTLVEVAAWVDRRKAAGEPHGQRPLADAFGIPRARAADLLRELRQSTPTDDRPARNGARVPFPTAG